MLLALVGLIVGCSVGNRVGSEVGHGVGSEVGHGVGSEVGHGVGSEVGSEVGHVTEPELKSSDPKRATDLLKRISARAIRPLASLNDLVVGILTQLFFEVSIGFRRNEQLLTDGVRLGHCVSP